MLAVHVTFEVWQLIIGIVVLVLSFLTLIIRIMKLQNGTRNSSSGNPGHAPSYHGVAKMVKEEKEDRIRETDELKAIAKDNARAIAGNTRAIGKVNLICAKLLVVSEARGERIEAISKKTTAILNKMGGQDVSEA